MSGIFADEVSADRSFAHFETMLGQPVPKGLRAAFASSADPDLSLRNLERWLASTASPTLYLQQVGSMPSLARLLLMALGASQPIADSLIQNPELGSLILDPQELMRTPNVDVIIAEGRRLLSASSSPSHALDRLRYLKQRWNLPIVIHDLGGSWPQAAVWTALSDLADALIALTVEAVWNEFARGKELPEACPVMVIGFGKLGGRELNYSSDVDLAYVIPDGQGEEFEREVTRFCERLGRALSDRMGRGSLYRVDMRLRPYGNAGPLVASMRAVENYYRLYAETWEIQALLKARPLVGPTELRERWDAMRTEKCFRPQLSEPELEAMLAMKSRIEERAEIDDLKRGAGGIRDVEFVVQALQMIHGYQKPELRVSATLQVLQALDRSSVLDHAVTTSLEESYTFLRQLEHRCQLVGDQQTHTIPEKPEARRHLAILMGFADWRELHGKLEFHRRTIQTLYKSILQPESSEGNARDQVAAKLGALAPSVLQWFDSLPSSEAFYASLVENRDSLDRVGKVALAAPRLVNELRTSVALTEMLVSGEIEDEEASAAQIERLPLDGSLRQVAEVYLRVHAHALTQWTLQPEMEIGNRLSELADALIVHCAKRLMIRFDIVALGSFGAREMAVESDADLLLLVEKTSQQSEAESQAQQLLSLLGQIKRLGAPIGLDLRLRPDGGKGMLVRSLEALGAYDLEGMEMWERFALGQARLVFGGEASIDLVVKIAYAQPLTPERLKELLAMKKRVETERVRPQHVRRDVKLGYGGLNDLEWLVHLHEMRFPTATQAGQTLTMPERIRALGAAGLLNAVEVEQLLFAREHLLELRLRLGLLGLEKDVIPENPDKLDRLAISMGFPEGNAFLAKHEQTIENVRSIYLAGLERLKA